jgi:plastocyanin
MRLRNLWVYGLGAALAISVVACGGGSQKSESGSAATTTGASAGGGKKVDAATAGELKGTVTLEGTAPKNATIKMMADPACMRVATGEQTMEDYMVGSDGKLANVFVYVKDGLGSYSFDVPTEPVVIDQQGCRYRPHVFGMRVGQPLQIVNSDPTLHNIHASAKVNNEFNNGQPIQGMKTMHTFTAPEVMVPFKCDVHGWMNAYVGVLEHPYFAVTTTDGMFDLKTLPPGTYTIEAWHEKLGTSTQTVTIGEKETRDITFTFKAPAVAAN